MQPKKIFAVFFEPSEKDLFLFQNGIETFAFLARSKKPWIRCLLGWREVLLFLVRIRTIPRPDMAVVPCRSWFLFRREYHRRPKLQQWIRAMGICLKDPTRLLEALCPWLFGKLGIPFILLDRGDLPNMGYPNFYGYVHACTVFMREMPLNRFHAFSNQYFGEEVPLGPPFSVKYRLDPGKLMPLSIGIPDSNVQQIFSVLDDRGRPEKTFDLTLIGSESSWERRRVMSGLEKLKLAGYKIFFGNQFPFKDYVEILARSWLVLSPPGNSYECWRHYEIPLAGAVPLLAVPTIFRQAPFRPNIEALYYFPDAEDFYEVAVNALRDKDRLRMIAEQGARSVLANHVWSKQREHILQTAFLSLKKNSQS